MAASRPGFPSEPNLRRLGVGGSGGGGGGDRTIRAQLLIALVLGFALVAAVLYVLRRPSAGGAPAGDAGGDGQAVAAAPSGKLVRTRLEPPKNQPSKERVTLALPQRAKCAPNARSRGNEGTLCDALPFFEEALKKAIADNVDCAPKTGEGGTLNYVLTVDFRTKRLGVFPGQSGAWKGPQAKKATECVRSSLPVPQWDSIPHQYGFYMIAILASYPAPEPLEGMTEFE